MNLYLRLLLVVLRAWAGRSLDPLATARTPFRVWPHDLDVNMHMNNGRYATLMDLGRVDLMARAGLLGAIRRAGAFPVVTGQRITYRRPLMPFRSFDLSTRVLGWDERSIYLEQHFEREGQMCATGLVQSLFIGPNGRMTSEETMRMFGIGEARAVPHEIAALFAPPPKRGEGAEGGAPPALAAGARSSARGHP